jgi:hypothetical protein
MYRGAARKHVYRGFAAVLTKPNGCADHRKMPQQVRHKPADGAMLRVNLRRGASWPTEVSIFRIDLDQCDAPQAQGTVYAIDRVRTVPASHSPQMRSRLRHRSCAAGLEK